jgi:uncharacterized membrane protein
MKFSTIIFALAICAALLATANIAIVLAIAVAVLILYKVIEIFGASKPINSSRELRRSSDKYDYIER